MSKLRLKAGSRSPDVKIPFSSPLRESREKLMEAERLRMRGQLEPARAICEQLVVGHGDYFGALHTLGLIYAEQGNNPMALGFLVRAAMLNPRSVKSLTTLSGVYLRLGAKEMAAQTLEQARQIDPRDAGVMFMLGEIYYEEREYELARDAYRDALALDPALEGAAVGLGTSCEQLGEHAEAVEIFEGFLKRGKRSLDLLFAFNQLPQSVVSIDVLKELDKVTLQPTHDKLQFETSAAFIRVASLDKAGEYAEAWRHLVPANRALFDQDDADTAAGMQRVSLAWLTDNKIKPLKGGGDRSRGQPISLFVLGPSRSGKTSMEKLIAALDGVKRGYENPIVESSVRRAFQAGGFFDTTNFALLPPQFYPECRQIYIEELERRAGSAKVFTNTHPGHMYFVGHIATAFPNARFVFVKRDPDDIALRIFMRKYKRGNKYSYNMRVIRDHVSWYHQMMDLMAERLPDRVRIVRYEDMVTDPAGALQVAADLCGLPMGDAPLPSLGDDRGCAEPYREFMAAELES